MPNIFATILIIFILSIISSNIVQADNYSQLPTKDEVQKYVDNLIIIYNHLVKTNKDLENQSILEYKDKFFLLRDEGEAFRVIAVRYDYKDNEWLTLVFNKIKYFKNEVELHYEQDLATYFGMGIYVRGMLRISEGGILRTNYTIHNEPLIFGVRIEEFKENYQEHSYDSAYKFYNMSIDDISYAIRKDKIWLPFKEKYNKTIFDNENFKKIAKNIDSHRLSEYEFYEIFENFSKEVIQEDFKNKSLLEKTFHLVLSPLWNAIKTTSIYIRTFIEKLNLIWKIIGLIIFLLTIIWGIYTMVISVLNRRKRSKKIPHLYTILARKLDLIQEKNLTKKIKKNKDKSL